MLGFEEIKLLLMSGIAVVSALMFGILIGFGLKKP
jgi:hypothetical protein